MFDTNSYIAEDWSGGYELELELTSQSDLENWTVDFWLPYKIAAAYGVQIIEGEADNIYTISGYENEASLEPGQTITANLIVEDDGQDAIVPEFTDLEFVPEEDYEDGETEIDTEDDDDSEFDDSTEESADSYEAEVEPSTDVANESDSQQTIDVDNDFGGDLQSAIAAADDGDVVVLGSNVYNTSGITLDKDITIDGQEGSVIDGGGTSESIINITSGATGATIQDVEITNGNNGIYGDGASNLTLQNLEVNNIGLSQTIRDGQNNSGITLLHADGLQLLDSEINNIGRKGVGILDTDGATVSGLTVTDINLQAEHTQIYDAAGIKLFNTNNVSVKDSYFARINAMHIWNDTTNGTVIENNYIDSVGSNFLAPSFDNNVNIFGIYNEKSANSTIRNNTATSVGEFTAFDATEFSTETMTRQGNNFSSVETNTPDYWVNESAEILIATTEDPYAADFDLFADEYFAQTNIG